MGLCIAALAAAPGCASNKVPVVTHPGEGVPTASTLLDRQWSQPAPKTLQGTTKMRIETPGRNARFRGVVLVQAPQELRAEVLSVLGQPVAYLVAAATTLDLYSPYSDTHVSTEDIDGVLERVAGRAMGAPDLVGLLLGQVPSCTPRDDGPLVDQGGTYAIQCVEGGEVSRTLTFDSESWLLRSVTGRSTDSGTFQVLLDDHAEVDGYMLPHHVQFTAPALGLDTELTWDELVLDQPIDPGLFVLAVPPGLETKSFEELLDRRQETSPPGGAPP